MPNLLDHPIQNSNDRGCGRGGDSVRDCENVRDGAARKNRDRPRRSNAGDRRPPRNRGREDGRARPSPESSPLAKRRAAKLQQIVVGVKT